MTRALILGSGVSGLAAARLATSIGWSVTVFDEAGAESAMAAGFPVATGGWDRELLLGVDLVVTSPGFPERSAPLVESLEYGVPIWSEIELAWRHLDAPVCAITGTNGKTTVTEMTSMMLGASGLSAPATGNIGSPLSDYANTRYDALVVEVSSFQLRFTEEFHPLAACITNVAVDHLDWHGSEASYRSAKAKLYRNQTEGDLLVYDADDVGATSLASLAGSDLYPVSGTRIPEGGGGFDDGMLRVNDLVVDVEELPFRDPVHLVNLAAAGALALRMGADADGVTTAMARYVPGKHRRTIVATSDNVTWIDDSKATNPHAALASIRAHDSVVLIAGGLAKGLDPTPLAEEAAVRWLLGIGESGPALVEAAGGRGQLAESLERAVEMAAVLAEPGDTVLLAPGCASFDQFENYSARGDRFAELVRNRVGGERG